MEEGEEEEEEQDTMVMVVGVDGLSLIPHLLLLFDLLRVFLLSSPSPQYPTPSPSPSLTSSSPLRPLLSELVRKCVEEEDDDDDDDDDEANAVLEVDVLVNEDTPPKLKDGGFCPPIKVGIVVQVDVVIRVGEEGEEDKK